MFVLSYDQKKLIDVTKVEVSKNLTAKADEKFVLYASGQHIDSNVVIGMYPTEEDAKRELRAIFTAIANGEAVYEIR